tara:strand:+ start:4786 stop:5631 length:846 start_codon:yes stop_codon:yes gene_type:complete
MTGVNPDLPQYISPAGLVGYYNFGLSVTVKDLSSTDNDGLVYGSADCTVDGPIDKMCSFDSRNSDYVRIPHHSNLDLSNQFTLSALFRPRNQLLVKDTIFAKSASDTSYGLSSLPTNTYTDLRLDGSNIGTSNSGQAKNYHWTHYVATYDGSTINQYLNGVGVATGSDTRSITPNSNPLEIGREFRGDIEEIAIWNNALSSEEIAALASSYSAAIDNQDPVCYWVDDPDRTYSASVLCGPSTPYAMEYPCDPLNDGGNELCTTVPCSSGTGFWLDCTCTCY